VKIGAEVKQAHLLPSWGDPRTGYIKSRAGSELAVPLLPYACDFVFRAGQSSIGHKFDSMWRVIGAIESKTDRRRPWAVFKVVEFLIQHLGRNRRMDLEDELAGQIDGCVVSSVLNNLGNAGLIDYLSPDREIEGKKAKGWSRYKLKDTQKLTFYKIIKLKEVTLVQQGEKRLENVS